MVRTPLGAQTCMWAQLLILFTVMSFRRSKLRSLAVVVSSSRRRRNGAIAVGETVAPTVRQCTACAPAVPGRKAHKSQRGPVQASIGVVRCNVRGAATADALLVIEDKREQASCTAFTAPRKSPEQCCASLSTPQNQRALHHLL